MTRAQQRLTDLLTKGDPPVLRKLLVEPDHSTLASLRGMLQRGMDDKVDALITDIAIENGFDIFAAGGTRFWQEDRIWTTRSGLLRREAELRELRETKLPENAEALARAASYGDLSENSEWENAIEEQRHLTEQAAQIERELRQTALLENAPIPDDTVCPGTFVRYREVASGQEHRLEILGPWDGGPETVSYRAPLAQGMMGLHPGDRALIDLPAGPLEVEVLELGLAAIA
jgi:transcription elongation factor GreA